MFIETETTPDPTRLRFLPGRPVLPSGTAAFESPGAAGRSPLAQRLFEVEGVCGVFLDADSITVRKDDRKAWDHLKPRVLGAIMQHFTSGAPVLAEAESEAGAGAAGEDGEIAGRIRELIDTRIRPTAAQSGGNVVFKGFADGVVLLEMAGSAYGLKAGIENMLRYYVPEVTQVKDFRDAMPKPGLETPEGRLVHRIIEERINPAVAAHGGHVALVDVRDDTVYIRLEGGCQGCGMADVTLKQGIEVEIKQVVPAIARILDVTDHAGGTNPYYQPGKGGISPF
jgi:Fe-S cluster biogenesis protein NfuA